MILRTAYLSAIVGGFIMSINFVHYFLFDQSEIVASSIDIGGVMLAVSLAIIFSRNT